MDRLSDLPEAVLHRILYFLNYKEGARTCVLSKSWRYIWSNRHQLRLRIREPIIRNKKNKEKKKVDFIFEANKTLQSLLDENHQGVQKLHLRISTLNPQSLAFLHKWLPLLTPMSIKHLNLHIILPKEKEDGDVTDVCVNDLPLEAFAAAKSLHKLHLHGCNLLSLSHQDKDNKLVNIPFKHNLRKLRLRHVSVQHSVVNKIVSSCRNLKTVLFEQCQGLTNIKITNNHQNLNHFTFIAHHSYTTWDCNIRIDLPPNIETIRIVSSRVLLRSREYSKLKSLFLRKVAVSADSFDNSSSSSFPSLENLTIVYSSLVVGGGFTCIDAPNMVTFKYVGARIPTLSFTSCPRKWWRSDINLLRRDAPQSWFVDLSKLLHSLSSHSRINLRILNQDPDDHAVVPVEENNNNNNDDDDNDNSSSKHVPVVVESLRLGGNVPPLALLDGLFCICRPRYICHYRYGPNDDLMIKEQKELTEFLCTTLLINTNQQQEEEEGIVLRPSDVKFQSLDPDGREWRFTEQNSLASIYTPTRFALNWSQDQ